MMSGYGFSLGEGMHVARRLMACVLALMLFGAMRVAGAQTVPGPSPARASVDANGVDMISGQLFFVEPGVSIGAGDVGLTHERYWMGAVGGFWRHAYEMWLHEPGGTKSQASMGSRSQAFDLISGVYQPASRNGSTLVQETGGYRFTDRDGTTVFFSSSVSGYSGSRFYATEIVRPSGEKVTLHYAYNSANSVQLL
ncbi:hypothetical protein, partial [Steroidobacter sp.]|uniref:hypothetical protein n=1 Tax=Steroidobacter sp. TaxID=1978227 RepID=UPI001A500633